MTFNAINTQKALQRFDTVQQLQTMNVHSWPWNEYFYSDTCHKVEIKSNEAFDYISQSSSAWLKSALSRDSCLVSHVTASGWKWRKVHNSLFLKIRHRDLFDKFKVSITLFKVVPLWRKKSSDNDPSFFSF